MERFTNAWFVVEVWIWCRIWRSTWKTMHLKVQCLATIVVQCSKLKIVWTVMCQGSIDNTKRPSWCLAALFTSLFCFQLNFVFCYQARISNISWGRRLHVHRKILQVFAMWEGWCAKDKHEEANWNSLACHPLTLWTLWKFFSKQSTVYKAMCPKS